MSSEMAGYLFQIAVAAICTSLPVYYTVKFLSPRNQVNNLVTTMILALMFAPFGVLGWAGILLGSVALLNLFYDYYRLDLGESALCVALLAGLWYFLMTSAQGYLAA